jgi:riboflavin biosynthesis pyrimidine reductase
LPPVVLLTASGRVDPSSRLFTERRNDQPDPPAPIVVTSERAGIERIEELRRAATVIVCGDDTVDVVAARAALAELGLRRIVCEGGPTLLGALLGAGALDELCLTHSPMLAGSGPHTSLGVGVDAAVAPARFEMTALAEADGMLFARYRPLGDK